MDEKNVKIFFALSIMMLIVSGFFVAYVIVKMRNSVNDCNSKAEAVVSNWTEDNCKTDGLLLQLPKNLNISSSKNPS